MAHQETNGVGGRQRLENLGVGGDTTDADRADRGEPDAHDRPEQASHGAGAESLNKKQGNDDRGCDRNDQAGD